MQTSSMHDQRSAPRFDANLPIHIGRGDGETHNISAHGVCFETDEQQRVGELVNFTVEFQLQGRLHRLLCEGKVVRVDREGGRVRVATRLLAPIFEATEEVVL
jgi:hypothetical protein